jgi:NitT/TauT family transport system substrate-binding protein
VNRLQKFFSLGVVFAGLLVCSLPAGAQQKSEISITRQPGILYLPSHVMEKQHLIEKEAAKLGIPDLKVTWANLNGGGAQTDALLSGSVDVVNTGVGNLLLLWDRTRGGVKGIVANSALPLTLITRDPNIRTLKDYTATDKIAVPTIKVSTQAILLQMASAKIWGPDQWAHLDPNTVQMSHPDAVIAMSNPKHEVRSHFASPPYSYYELQHVPGARIVATSPSIIGGPLTQSQFFTTVKFADANPKFVEAIRNASDEAIKFIDAHPREAGQIYLEMSHDKMSLDDLMAMLKEPGMMQFGTAPQGTMKFAAHLYKIGTLKTMPKSWKDYYLPTSADLDGN